MRSDSISSGSNNDTSLALNAASSRNSNWIKDIHIQSENVALIVDGISLEGIWASADLVEKFTSAAKALPTGHS
jgi:hypothetical protein